ncbi:hypothetical protein ACI65C_012637, partial [Semiaphis heraclei]
IEILFPTESKETYFIPREKEANIVTPNRGKLFDKYCNVKRKISKILNYKRKKPEPEAILKSTNLNEKDDHDLAALQLIPFLFSPVNIVLKNKKVIRPSKIEQSNAFIVKIP